jgi:Holliday junction resolvase RusA-like endonuclease
MKLVIPRVTPSGNEMRRKYRNRFAYKRLRETWEVEILCAISPKHVVEMNSLDRDKKLGLIITRFGKKLLDRDNLYSGIKAPLDAMVRLGIIKGDSDKYIELAVKQEQAKETRTEIIIEEFS